MLALDRPLGVVADLALFGDHIDRNRVFYIPTRPRLAQAGSGDELSFVKFRRAAGADGGVGFFSFTAELSASAEQLKEASELLRHQGVSEPVLVQTPWVTGKAYLAAALKEGDGFVEHLLGEVTPDLAGTNRAVFSLLLTEDGARLVEALLDTGAPNPLGVRYELEYQGLRPALAVKLRADTSRIYKELSFGFELGVAYEGVGVRASVESATKKLVESGAIQIEVLHFTDDADLKARVDEAIRWFEQKIIEDFFKSSLQPPPRETLLSQAVDAAKALGAASLDQAMADQGMASQLAQKLGISNDALKGLAGQGAGGKAAGSGGGADSTFALKLQFTFRDIKQEELKTLTLDWSEARAERRTAAPQGLMSSLGAPPKIVEAEDSGAFWDRLQVEVRPLGDFNALGVDRMVVQLAYPDESAERDQKAFVFEAGQTDPRQYTVWTDGRGPNYRARTEVHFRDNGPWPGDPVFTGEWRTSQSLELAVHPLAETPRIEVELSSGSLNFEETPQVQLDLRLDETPIGSRRLTAAEPLTVFRFRPKPGTGPGSVLEVRPTWFLAGGRMAQGDWAAVEGTSVLVGRPWRDKRTVRVFPLLPADFIEASVSLTMADGDRTASAEARFAAGERRVKTVELPSLSAPAPPVRVDALVIRGDGSVFMGNPYQTTEPVILLRDREGEQRQLTVKLLSGPTLAGHGLMAVQVQLLGGGDEVLDSVVFTESQRGPGIMLAPVGEKGPTPVRYRVVRYALTGSASAGPALESPGPELLIPAVAAS